LAFSIRHLAFPLHGARAEVGTAVPAVRRVFGDSAFGVRRSASDAESFRRSEFEAFTNDGADEILKF